MKWNVIYRYWPAALAASLGIIASLVLFEHARATARDRVSAELSAQAEGRARDLQDVLSRYEGMIEGFAAAFPYQNIDAERFRVYAKSVSLASSVLQSGFKNLGWAPRILDRDRAAFEATAREEHHGDYAILEKTADGSLITAPQGPDYYPLRYIEPLREKSPLGLDLASNVSLQRAIVSGVMTATSSMPMIDGPDASLLFVPVYPTATNGKTGGAPVGALTFRMSISTAIDAIIAEFEPVPAGLDFYVIDDAAPPAQRLIYEHAGGAAGGQKIPESDSKALIAPYWGSSFNFAGRDFTMIVRATPRLLGERLAGAGWLELSCVFLLTALLTLYLITTRTRAERLRQLAESLQREV